MEWLAERRPGCVISLQAISRSSTISKTRLLRTHAVMSHRAIPELLKQLLRANDYALAPWSLWSMDIVCRSSTAAKWGSGELKCCKTWQ